MPSILWSVKMKTNELYKLAEKEGIQIDRIDLKTNSSVAINMMDKLFVGLDRNICGAEERVCLAHEIGHCQTMSFYNINSPLDVRGKHERRANVWAIKAMIPYNAYRYALEHGCTEIYSLADYFNVTEDFMRKAVEYYKSVNNT